MVSYLLDTIHLVVWFVEMPTLSLVVWMTVLYLQLWVFRVTTLRVNAGSSLRPSAPAQTTLSNLNPCEILEERLRTLEETASLMSRAVVSKGSMTFVNRHPDYEFFSLGVASGDVLKFSVTDFNNS